MKRMLLIICLVLSLSYKGLATNACDLVEHNLNNYATYKHGNFKNFKCEDEFFTYPVRPNEPTPQTVLINSESFFRSIIKKIIFSNDGRKRISNTTNWPYSIHVSLSIKFVEENSYYGGSGILVGPHHILTAGHNIYYDEKKKWATRVVASPGLNDQVAPYGEVNVVKAYVFSSWLKMRDPLFDMAILILDTSIGYQTGWAGLLCPSENTLTREQVSITGYPGDKGFKQMWSMSKRLKNINQETFSYTIDTYGGQSGSGIWINRLNVPHVLGVHTLGSEYSNSGVRLSLNKYNKIYKIINDTYILDINKNYLSSFIREEKKHLKETWSNLKDFNIENASISFTTFNLKLFFFPSKWIFNKTKDLISDE